MQRVPRVWTPNMPQVPRVQLPPSVPATHTDNTKRIKPSVPRVHSKVPTTNNMPTDSAIKNAFGSNGHHNYARPPHHLAHPLAHNPQSRAQVAMAAARVAPPSTRTRSRVQSNALPSSRQPGFMAAVIRQQRHQHGGPSLTTHHTTGE